MRLGEDKKPRVGAVALSLAAGGLPGVTEWMGGKLVDCLRVGIDDGAHLNAPNSLSGLPASDDAA